jgi:phosphate acetyltransferase
MSRNIILVPTSSEVGLTSISIGLVHALERHGLKVQFFQPFAQKADQLQSNDIVAQVSSSPVLPTFPQKYAQELVANDQLDELLESLLASVKKVDSDTEITIIEGLVTNEENPFAQSLNQEISNALDADVVFVAQPGSGDKNEVGQRLNLIHNAWGGKKNKRILGCVLNKIGAPVNEAGELRPDLEEVFDPKTQCSAKAFKDIEKKTSMAILGRIPFDSIVLEPRASDLAKHLNAEIINAGEMNTRRLKNITFCARSLPNLVKHITAGSLLVTSGDRADVIVAATLAAKNGVKIGAVLLTSGYKPETNILELCQQGLETGLPVFLSKDNTWQTAQKIQNFDRSLPHDDLERIRMLQEHIASHINTQWLDSLTHAAERQNQLSPPAFRYQLTELARAAKKRVVLPEGDEPRTVKAAAICAERGIATCVLIGDKTEIERVAAQEGVKLGKGVEIIEPQHCLEKYVAPMVELRKHKGLTDVVAREQLQDTVVLGTMMLAEAEVDGLVSGAVHTTANTIRPPLQLIKTAPGSSLVSSVFFMLMPNQVYVYGDCAINPDPTADQLADIAIQSADSASAFGIEPKVAMISYSTGSSGTGTDVEKVREATRLAQEKRPDLLIDGPLQYDAAVMPNVAASKAPNSKVAGQANVFIFPDLNTGNTTYKAVQRSADLISIGPMLQGMRKPVNDLSRGALVDDIVYTIALTAIQATQI